MYRQSKMSFFSQTLLSASNSSSISDYSGFKLSDDADTSESSDDDFSSDVESIFVTKEFNAVKSVINNEAYCFNVPKFSEKLVEATFFEAKKQLKFKQKTVTVFDIVVPVLQEIIHSLFTTDSDSNFSPPAPELWSSARSSSSFSSSSETSLLWPKISEFNIKLGLEKLEEYVKTWKRPTDWLFCVEFLGFESEDCSNVFVYEVEWSQPSNEYPIPQATASVYFAMEVFKMVPYNCDRCIDVTYVFESSNVIHVPGRIDFQEKWLQDIIDVKTKVYKKITYAVQLKLETGSTFNTPI